MILRTLFCRLRINQPLLRTAVSHHSGVTDPVQQQKNETQTKTFAFLNSSVSFPRTARDQCWTLGQAVQQDSHMPQCFNTRTSSAVSSDLTQYRSVQTRFYSTLPIKTVFKPAFKSVPLPGKRIPKGPRTKQPSRANQPVQEDKVPLHQT